MPENFCARWLASEVIRERTDEEWANWALLGDPVARCPKTLEILRNRIVVAIHESEQQLLDGMTKQGKKVYRSP